MKKIWLLFLLLLFGTDVYAEDAGFWQRIYTQVSEAYVYEITPEELAIAALKSLRRADKSLTVGDDKERITLYYQGKVVKVLRKPKDRQDAAAWGRLTEAVVTAAAENSRRAEKYDFATADILVKGMSGILDKDSKFYGSMDEAEGVPVRNQRTFAARPEGKSLYIKIGAFNKQTLRELQKSVAEYASAEELVLDLRGCPGGMLGEAIKAAGLFLDSGIVASVRGKPADEEVYYTADPGDIWQGKPITVLVDEETASAAEVIAAALQEQGRAEIAGSKTKGKGSIQKLIILPGGSVLAVTSGFFMTPSGRELNGKGITPDKKLPEIYEN